MTSKPANNRSFSLIELMIVITIVSLLAIAGIPSYLNNLQRASITEAVAILAEYKLSLSLFWSVEERLPTTGDTLNSSPANLPFGTVVTNATDPSIPDSIASLQLTSSGNGIVIYAVVQGQSLSTVAVNNRTLTLGMQPSGSQLTFACGNFTTNATLITDIGFTNISNLPTGCNYNGVGAWLSS